MLLKKSIPWTYILGKIKFEIAIVTLYATAFGLFHEALNLHHVTIPLTIPTIVGTIISLLLAFRSNQAYDRWWEARIIWGAIVNDSRTLVRQIISFTNDPDYDVVNQFITRFAKRQMFWCHSLGQMLRGRDARELASRFLHKEELKLIHQYRHVPNALLLLHGKDLRYGLEQKWINSYQQVEIDQTISRLCDAMGKCERIKNTVFPTTYSLYINFALYLFIVLLPFGLTEFMGIILIPVVILISGSFLLIEKMAIHLQDPFEGKPTDTPMTTIAQNIERDLREMTEEAANEHLIRNEPKVAERFYVL